MPLKGHEKNIALVRKRIYINGKNFAESKNWKKAEKQGYCGGFYSEDEPVKPKSALYCADRRRRERIKAARKLPVRDCCKQLTACLRDEIYNSCRIFNDSCRPYGNKDRKIL